MTWTQQDFERMYWIQVGNPAHPLFGQWVSYGKTFAECMNPYTPLSEYTRLAQGLVSRANYTPGNKALFVGCGFGYLMHMIKSQYPDAQVWGTDTSAWIQANKATECHTGIADLVLNIDITANDALTLLRPYTGGNGRVSWVITDDMINTIADANLAGFLNSCEAILATGGKVAHLVRCAQAGREKPEVWTEYGFSWKTLAEWAAIRPTHYWIDIETLQSAGGV